MMAAMVGYRHPECGPLGPHPLASPRFGLRPGLCTPFSCAHTPPEIRMFFTFCTFALCNVYLARIPWWRTSWSMEPLAEMFNRHVMPSPQSYIFLFFAYVLCSPRAAIFISPSVFGIGKPKPKKLPMEFYNEHWIFSGPDICAAKVQLDNNCYSKKQQWNP